MGHFDRVFSLQLFSDEGVLEQVVEAVAEQTGGVGNSSLINDAKPGVKYEFAVPDGFDLDDGRVASYSALAEELGLSAEHANKIADYGFNFARELQLSMMHQRIDEHMAQKERAKEALGADLPRVARLAGVAMERLERDFPDLRKVFDDTGAGNYPEVIKAMAFVGELMTEDNGARIRGSSMTPRGGDLYDKTDFSKYKF